MKKKGLKHLAAAMLFAMAVMIGVPAGHACAASSKTVKIKTENRQFTMVGLPYPGALNPVSSYKKESLNVINSIQNFAFSPDHRYIFTTEEATGKSGNHTLLSWSALPDRGQWNKDAQAQYCDTLILGKYGHGEGLTVTQPNKSKSVYNIWVSKGTNQVARITLSIDAEGKGKVQKNVTITNFQKAVPSNASGTADRMGIGADEASNRIAFRIHAGGTYYEIYNLKKLDYHLDKVKDGKTYNIKKAESYRIANVKYNLVPLSTYQSFDIDKNYIYVCGGHFNIGAQIYKVKYKTVTALQDLKDTITKTIKLNLGEKKKPTIEFYDPMTEKTQKIAKDLLEIEGMKVEANGGKTDYYVNFVQKGFRAYDTVGIYKFTD